jgi:hypothetical protein
MKNIESVLQIKNGVAVISDQDLAVLLGRKRLSVLRAVDAIPSEHLTKDNFFMVDDEVFLTQDGICMLDMSVRHLRMRRRIMLALSIFDADYREARWAEFHSAMPPRAIIKLLTWLGDVGLNQLALILFKLICWFKNYDPSKTVNIHKSAQ